MTPVNEGAAFFFFFFDHKIGQFNFAYLLLHGLLTTTETRLDIIYCILKEQYICCSSGKLFILFNDKYALPFQIKKNPAMKKKINI